MSKHAFIGKTFKGNSSVVQHFFFASIKNTPPTNNKFNNYLSEAGYQLFDYLFLLNDTQRDFISGFAFIFLFVPTNYE